MAHSSDYDERLEIVIGTGEGKLTEIAVGATNGEFVWPVHPESPLCFVSNEQSVRISQYRWYCPPEEKTKIVGDEATRARFELLPMGREAGCCAGSGEAPHNTPPPALCDS